MSGIGIVTITTASQGANFNNRAVAASLVESFPLD
jgi:hypothetical protein